MKRKYLIILIVTLGCLVIGGFSTFASSSQGVMNVPQKTNKGMQGQGMGGYFAGTMHEIVAELLEMTSEELWEQCLEGKTWRELAAEKGIGLEELQGKMLEKKKKQLDDLVSEGKITVEQKDAMLKRIAENTGNGKYPMMRGSGMGKGQHGGNKPSHCRQLGNR